MDIHEQIVISGIGVVSPIGYCIDEYAKKISNEYNYRPEVSNSSRKSEALAQCTLNQVPHGLSRRQVIKIDRFTELAIFSTRAALCDALYTSKVRNRMGLLIGNVFGGWSYVESQMYALCQGDMDSINSYVSTAWFPAAAQGEISILENISGISKTFSAGGLSSAYAIEYAFNLIKSGILDSAIAGGAESPINTVVTNSLIESGELLLDDKECVSESAGMMLIEKASAAKTRGCDIYAIIAGFSYGTDMHEAVKSCLEVSHWERANVDLLIMPDISKLDGYNCFNLSYLQGKSSGADFALNVINACLLMKYNKLHTHRVKHVLVLGYDNAGHYLCMALSRNGRFIH